MLADWLASAKRGEAFEYARGDLAHSRYWRVRRRMMDQPTPDLDGICDAGEDAWRLFLAGRVTLTQRRLGKHKLAYFAVRL
jgi:hypothetical protein